MVYCKMSEDRLCAELDTNETFAETICSTNNESFDFSKYGPYIDKVKPFLVSSLEGRIYSGLKEFVCDPSSRCSKCFPCVNRWLETSAAWADYIDAFFTKDTTVGEEMIKCAMKCLAKDGLVTQFTNSDGLNNGVDRMCHGLDAIVVDQNDLKSMNVCRYISEKDYWLSEGCANAASIDVIFKPPNEHLKGNGSSDLEVEVDSCSERTCERSADLQQNRMNNNTLNREENISDCACRTENNTRCWKNTRNAKTCDCRIERRTSKLKVLIYQTTKDNSSTGLTPVKVTNLTVPCRPSHLIVRIFEAAPSLSESCLILMRKKFENGIQTACSCLNGILRKLDNAEMKELRLVCEIRPGYIDLNLRRPRTSKPRLFLARLPTCRSHPKRESCCKHTYSCENSGGFQYRRNSDISNCFSKQKAKCNEGIAKEMRHVMFYLSGSHYDSVSETTRSSSEDEKVNEKVIMGRLCSEKKVSEKDMKFVWTRKPVKEVSFCLTNEEAKESVTSSDDNNTERSCKSEVCDNVDRSYIQEEVSHVRHECSHIKQTAVSCDKDISNNIVAERTADNIESCDSGSSCYPDSLRKVEQSEDCSMLDNCNSQQCLCHVLYARSDRNAKENAESQSAENMDEGDNVQLYCLQNDIPNSTVKSERQQIGNGIIQMKKSNSVEQSAPTKKGASGAKQTAKLGEKFSADSICSLKSNYTGASCDTKCSCCGEDLSDVEINIKSENLTISIESKLTASRTEVSIREDEPNENKPYPAPVRTVENVDRIFCMQDSMRTLSSNNFSAFQPSRMISHVERENTGSSIQNFRATALFDRPESSNKKMINYKIGRTISNDVCKNSAAIYDGKPGVMEADGNHEIVSTNTEQFSCRSNVPGSLLENDLRGRDRERKPGSPCRRTSLRSKFQKKSRHSMRFTNRDSYSTQDLREGKSKSHRKKVQNHSDCSCKNRFWNRGVTSSYLCGSFPAASLDRLKYLIRKKLRRLLLEERNKGTNTSKTFLRNERYYVSASSEKLNEGIRDTSSSDRLNHCSCVIGDSGGIESNASRRKKGTLDYAVKSRCQKVTRCGVFKRIKVARDSSSKRDSKLIGTCCSTGEGTNDVRRTLEAMSIGTAGDSSTKRFFVEDDAKQSCRKNEKQLGVDGVIYTRSQNRKKKCENQFCTNSPSKRSSMKSPCGNCRVCDCSTSSFEAAKTKKSICNMSSGDIRNTRKSKNLRLFKGRFESRVNCDKDIVIFYSDYERYVNDICADFRLKLLQYVALCKSVKDTFLKRLQSDAFVIRSNST
ncbi:uncharacterized protein LOC143221935 [Lasioglossum baleicum]|uniref:uncharacterized protein LOC143221935 n=1 Tax=Lasioglossum baleicum TaxID=434251 RepID=UPI003FCC923A